MSQHVDIEGTLSGAVLVSGANGGIGCSICQHLGAQGWQVIATDLQPTSSKGHPYYIQLDLEKLPSNT